MIFFLFFFATQYSNSILWCYLQGTPNKTQILNYILIWLVFIINFLVCYRFRTRKRANSIDSITEELSRSEIGILSNTHRYLLGAEKKEEAVRERVSERVSMRACACDYNCIHGFGSDRPTDIDEYYIGVLFPFDSKAEDNNK